MAAPLGELIPARCCRRHATGRLRRDELPRHLVGRRHPRQARGGGRHGPRRNRDPGLDLLGQLRRRPAQPSTGQNFVVTWEDARSGNADIYGARVGTDGNVLDSDGFPIAAGSSSETTPAATAGSPGRVAVSYERANQAFLRFVDSGAASAATTPAPTSSPTAAGVPDWLDADFDRRLRLRSGRHDRPARDDRLLDEHGPGHPHGHVGHWAVRLAAPEPRRHVFVHVHAGRSIRRTTGLRTR